MGDQWVDIPLPRTNQSTGDFATEIGNMMAFPSSPGSDMPYFLRSVPGIDLRYYPGTGDAMRGAIAHGDYVWFVLGTKLRRWDGTTATLVGTVSGTDPVHMVGIGPNQIAIVDGAGNEYTANTGAVTAMTPPAGDFGDVTFMDGYIIAPRVGTDEWYVSALDGSTFDPLQFSTADAISDTLVGAYVHNREIHLFGKKHIEIWVDTGGSPFPFTRAVPGVIDKGCLAPASIAHYASTLFFVGPDFRVYKLDGYAPVPISTDIVEENIRISYTSAKNMRASCFVDRGAPCYALTISIGGSGYAWVYNIKDDVWHYATHTDGGSALIDYVDIVEFPIQTFVTNIAAVYSTSAARGFEHGLYSHTYANVQDQGSGAAVSRDVILSIGPLQEAGGKRVFNHETELTANYDTNATVSAALTLTGDEGVVMKTAATVSGHGGAMRWMRNGAARRRGYDFVITSDQALELHRLRIRADVGL